MVSVDDLDELVLLEVFNNHLDSSGDIDLVRLDVKFRVRRSFVRCRDSGEICSWSLAAHQ